MELLLCYVVIYLSEALIFWLYCNDLFIRKYTLCRTAISLSILYGILFSLSWLNIYPLNAIAFFTANFIFIYVLYDTKMPSALFHAGITTTVMGLGELLSLSFFPDFARNFYETRSNIILLIICTSHSKLIYFFIVYILSHLRTIRKKEKTANSRGTLILVPIPLVTFFVMFTLYVICLTTDISISINQMIAFCCILLIFLNLLIWFFFSYTQKRNQDFVELQLSLQRENDTAEYYRMMSAQNETKNILIHNIKGHLYTISVLAEQHQQTEIVDYINNLAKTSSLQTTDSLQLCKNDILNAILCRYKEMCKEQDIDFRTDIRNDCIDFMTANDLTALFCNLLDNALEAASCVSDSFIEINITPQEEMPYTILSVRNSCQTDPFDSHGKLPSHKKDTSRHGLGVKSIRRTVKNYGGDIEFYYEEKTSTFHAVARIKKG